MSAPGKRPDAGAAVGGLFERASATGGLAGREHPGESNHQAPSAPSAAGRATAAGAPNGRPAVDASAAPVVVGARVRLGVELTERETAFLRALSRPSRTGGPRTLGSKFVGTGILAAAIELLAQTGVDMHGVAGGDLPEMTARARAALLRAAALDPHTEERDDPPR